MGTVTESDIAEFLDDFEKTLHFQLIVNPCDAPYDDTWREQFKPAILQAARSSWTTKANSLLQKKVTAAKESDSSYSYFGYRKFQPRDSREFTSSYGPRGLFTDKSEQSKRERLLESAVLDLKNANRALTADNRSYYNIEKPKHEREIRELQHMCDQLKHRVSELENANRLLSGKNHDLQRTVDHLNDHKCIVPDNSSKLDVTEKQIKLQERRLLESQNEKTALRMELKAVTENLQTLRKENDALKAQVAALSTPDGDADDADSECAVDSFEFL